MKDTHGSIEATSIGQMTNILQYGSYIIGSTSSSTCRALKDMVRVVLSETEKPLPRKHYSLEELQNLESKLVLITGSDAPERQQVDDFLEVNNNRN